MSADPLPKRAAVLGAGGGIGQTLVRILAKSGWQQCLGGRSVEHLQPLMDEFNCPGSEVDATDPRQMADFMKTTSERLGGLSGVAVCVGSMLLKPAHRTSSVEWDSIVATNLSSAFYALQSAVANMEAGGSIVFVSSAAARIGLANHEAIAAAKAGLIGLTLAASATYATRSIRVNCVAPGLTQTPMTEKLVRTPAMRAASEAMHPIGRLGMPEDVASAMAWFLDPEQSWVTGQVLGVDGGLADLKVRQTVQGY